MQTSSCVDARSGGWVGGCPCCAAHLERHNKKTHQPGAADMSTEHVMCDTTHLAGHRRGAFSSPLQQPPQGWMSAEQTAQISHSTGVCLQHIKIGVVSSFFWGGLRCKHEPQLLFCSSTLLLYGMFQQPAATKSLTHARADMRCSSASQAVVSKFVFRCTTARTTTSAERVTARCVGVGVLYRLLTAVLLVGTCTSGNG